jgi:predicted nucleic acid-binding protein
MLVTCRSLASVDVRELWDSSPVKVSSRLLYPEARSALARGARSCRISSGAHARAQVELDLLSDELSWSELDDGLARRAGHLAEAHGLRGADAVHLAAAAELADEEAVFVTADAAQRSAAVRLGLATAKL